MRIGELGRLTGVKSETIRFYEKAGLLPPPERTLGNYRVYTQDHVQRLGLIREARGLGFDLQEVQSFQRLRDEPGKRSTDRSKEAKELRILITEKLESLSKLLGELDRVD